MNDVINDRFRATPHCRMIRSHGDWREGVTPTPHGLVWVYSQAGHMRMDFAHEGYVHTRTIWRKDFATARGLCRMAARFAAEVVGLAQ